MNTNEILLSLANVPATYRETIEEILEARLQKLRIDNDNPDLDATHQRGRIAEIKLLLKGFQKNIEHVPNFLGDGTVQPEG